MADEEIRFRRRIRDMESQIKEQRERILLFESALDDFFSSSNIDSVRNKINNFRKNYGRYIEG
jgi:uncharacterized protein YeeX (DUF496 family)